MLKFFNGLFCCLLQQIWLHKLYIEEEWSLEIGTTEFVLKKNIFLMGFTAVWT